VPVETHYFIRIIERYHAPIRRAYTIITEEVENINRDMALQMAFKATNNTAGSDELVFIFLVYRAYLRMTEYDPPTPTIAQRAAAIKKAMTELRKIKAKIQIYNALNTRNRPSTTDIYNLPLNSDVMVWRAGNTGQSGSWQGPYKLVGIDSKLYILVLPQGNTIFRSISVKPYLTDTSDNRIQIDNADSESSAEHESSPPIKYKTSPPAEHKHPPTGEHKLQGQPLKRERERPRKNPITIYLSEN
jgi:hypothetical protein